MGRKHGLDVWMAVNGPRMQIVYSTPDKKAIIHDNTIYSAGPKDETEIVQREFIMNNPEAAHDILQKVGSARQAIYASSDETALRDTTRAVMRGEDPASVAQQTVANELLKPLASKRPSHAGEALWSELNMTRYVLFGRVTNNKIVYMFTDPKCNHCHTLWNTLEPLASRNQIQLRLVPVAILGTESELLSAQWLSQDDHQEAWLTILANQNLPKSSSPSGASAYNHNQRLLTKYKLFSTPILVYRQNGSGTVRIIKGAPRDMDIFLKDLGVTNTQKDDINKNQDTKTQEEPSNQAKSDDK